MPNVFIRIRKPPAPGERHHPQGQGNEAMNGQHLGGVNAKYWSTHGGHGRCQTWLWPRRNLICLFVQSFMYSVYLSSIKLWEHWQEEKEIQIFLLLLFLPFLVGFFFHAEMELYWSRSMGLFILPARGTLCTRGTIAPNHQHRLRTGALHLSPLITPL